MAHNEYLVVRLHDVFCHLWCKLWYHFFNTQEVVENMCFGKMLSFQWTKSSQSFFSSFRTGRTSRNSLHGYRRYSDTYWANCKIIFLGLKRSKGIKLKKRRLSSLRKKWLSPILSPITDYDRHRVFFQPQRCFLAFVVLVMKTVL